MNGWWQPDEIMYGLELTKPKVLIVDEKRYQRIARPAHRRAGSRHRTRLRRHGLGRDARCRRCPTAPSTRTTPSAILFTSGTTGRPKGAISTHRNLIGVRADLDVVRRCPRACSFPNPPTAAAAPPTNIVSAPLFHVSGLQSAAISGIAHGIRYIWTTGRFDPEADSRDHRPREAHAAWAVSPRRCGASSSTPTSTSTTSRT